jgi:AcrR family transcriptional regulator
VVAGGYALRAVRTWQGNILEPASECGILETMLLRVGARGYERASVQEVLDRSGIAPEQFQRRFGSKDECFGRAYAALVDHICEDLLEAGRNAGSWRSGFRAALAQLLHFVAERPLLAKALLIEVRAARGGAWAKHQQGIERMAAAVDRARSECGALASASPITADFMVGGIEELVGLEIRAGRAAAVERLLPNLSYFVLLNYFGEDQASLELCSAN